MVTIFMIVLLITAALYDIKTMHIPLWLAISNILLGFFALCKGIMIDDRNVREYTLTIVILVSVAITGIVLRVLKAEVMGIGDIILMITTGMILSGEELVLLLSMTLILSGVFSGVLLVMGKVGRTTRIPFVPFLAAGTIVTELFFNMKGII